METTQIALEPMEMLQLMGILLLGYMTLMGMVYILFKALFPAISVKEMSRAKKRTNELKSGFTPGGPLRLRKMRLTQ